MTSPTEECVADSSDQGQPAAAVASRYRCRRLITVCIALGVLANAAWMLGAHELLGPKATFLALLATLVIAAAWPVAMLLAIRRRAFLSNWLALILGTAVCWGGLLLAFTVFFWIPMSKISPRYHDDPDKLFWSMMPENADEVRSVCHRALVWHSDPHDVFVSLGHWGNESSVPYMLWSLRWMPSKDPRDCTWAHGLDALRRVTNQDAGETREGWVEWYAANKDRSVAEWWADGFTAEGYPVSAAGGAASIRNLLAVLGRTPWCQADGKPWLSDNALRMLDSLNKDEVRRVIDSVLEKGSVEERCGAARYASELDRDHAETILRRLLQDEQRVVRLHASGALCRLQLEWLENPPGYVEKRFPSDEMSEKDFFSPPGKEVVVANKGIQINPPSSHSSPMGGEELLGPSGWQGGQADSDPPDQDYPHVRIEAVPASETKPERLGCVIRVDWPEGAPGSPARDDAGMIGIEGGSPTTGKTVYSKDIMQALDADELLWLYDRKSEGIYITVPNYTCKIDPATGRILWEIGFGVGRHDGIRVIGGYVLINCYHGLVICDAARGEILATYDHRPPFRLRKLALVDGRLRIEDLDGAFYILALPEKG